MRLPKRTAEDEHATAVHESGHAVIARVLKLKCGKVTIEAKYRTGTSGYGIIYDPEDVIRWWVQCGRDRLDEAAFRGRILAFMAGREAEEELLGYCEGGDDDDQRWIARMLEDLYPGEWDRQDKFERRLRSFTRHLVRRHRSKIEALSRALLEQRTMSDKRVRLAAGLPPRLRRLSRRRPTVAGAELMGCVPDPPASTVG
jgi:ATP-dependent Zn protease